MSCVNETFPFNGMVFEVSGNGYASSKTKFQAGFLPLAAFQEMYFLCV